MVPTANICSMIEKGFLTLKNLVELHMFLYEKLPQPTETHVRLLKQTKRHLLCQ